MKLPQISKRKWSYKALAFAFPCVGMLFVMLFSQYTPFGNYSMLYSDMYHQYYPFFVSFRNALLSGDSLLYSWNVGLGIDYLGLISYYLASPLNLLSILVPEGLLLQYFSLLVPIKLGLAGLFFSIFLEKIFHKNDISLPLFGSFYALCAWALGYQWNIMWLDTFALLPLVVLGMVSLLKERKFFLYTITLFFSIVTNYYVGFFTCIFIFLIFFCYEICRWNGVKKFFADLAWIALYSALAIGMTAFLELPALAALQTTQSSVNQFPEGFKLNIADENTWKGLLTAMRQVAGNMNGGLEPTFKEGLPNLYCGVIANILAFLYLTCRQIKLRDKVCAVLLLVFFNLSFIIRQLDYIWHGFHFTNMIPYRFSFLHSFVLLYMAYHAYTQRRHFRIWQIILAGGLSVGIILCSKDLKNQVLWAYNGLFLLFYIGTLMFTHYRKPIPQGGTQSKALYLQDMRKRRKTGALILSSVFSVELILNLVNFAIWFPGTNISNYPMGKEATASMIRYMKERESKTLFYRAEMTHSQTLNDGALNGYNGISTFTSSANVNVTKFMKALGYSAKDTYNRYCFEESSPISNLFLGIKYMLERQGKLKDNAYFDQVHSYENVYLLENNAYLPLGFLANSQLINMDFGSNSNPFYFQNNLFKAASGVEKKPWIELPGSSLTINSTDAELSSVYQNGHCTYSTEANAGGSVTYSYTADRNGFMCIYLDFSKRNSYTVFKNGQELFRETYSLPQMISVSDVVSGDVIEVKLTCKENEKGNLSIQAAILDEEIFRQGYAVLAESPLELTRFDNTHVEGTINCDRDGVLYTSIPQNGNWIAEVDGIPTQTVLIGDAMVGILLTKGSHEITLSYHNRAFQLGWQISLASAVIFVGLYLAIYRPKRYAGKYQKQKN